MIIVLADDFTGAAEIAGIGHQYGMNAEVQTEFSPDTTAELLVIDTHSRSCSPSQAAGRVKTVMQSAKTIMSNVDWIYKKTDSVLRGPIVSELNTLLGVLDAKKVLLVPANPSKGRIIRQGQYFIEGQPLSETDFANDVEYPTVSSDVLELLSLSPSSTAGLLKCGQFIPKEGIFVGEAETNEDVQNWTLALDDQTIPAGAADFFAAILKTKGLRGNSSAREKVARSQYPALFVFGSASDYSRKMLRKAKRLNRAVCSMPKELLIQEQLSDRLLRQWANETVVSLKKNDSVIVAIDQTIVPKPEYTKKLACYTATMIQKIFADVTIGQLYIEGGATASAIVRRLGWKRLDACGQSAPGVIQMRVVEKENHYLTIKPGSYPWPNVIWNLIAKGKSHAK